MNIICNSCTFESGLWGSPSPHVNKCNRCINGVTLANNFVPKVGIENERSEYIRLKQKFEG